MSDEFQRGRVAGLNEAIGYIESLQSEAYSEQSAAQERYNAQAGAAAEEKLGFLYRIERRTQRRGISEMTDDRTLAIERARETAASFEAPNGPRRAAILAGELDHTIPVRVALAALALAPPPPDERLRKALGDVLAIPAIRQVLGTKHTLGCDCPICRANALLATPTPDGADHAR